VFLSELRKTPTKVVSHAQPAHRLPGEHKVLRFTPGDFQSSESLPELPKAPVTPVSAPGGILVLLMF